MENLVSLLRCTFGVATSVVTDTEYFDVKAGRFARILMSEARFTIYYLMKGGEKMTRRAHIGAIAACVIGLVATLIVGAIGVAVSICVANNAQAIAVDCALNQNNASKAITVNADKGKLYYALESGVSQDRTGFNIHYKASKSGSYSRVYSGYLDKGDLVGYNYAGKASGWSKRYFKVAQTNHLTSKATHAYFYADVR